MPEPDSKKGESLPYSEWVARYSIARRRLSVESRKNPRPKLQGSHNNARTRPVVWQWSITSRLGCSLQIAQRPSWAKIIASRSAYLRLYFFNLYRRFTERAWFFLLQGRQRTAFLPPCLPDHSTPQSMQRCSATRFLYRAFTLAQCLSAHGRHRFCVPFSPLGVKHARQRPAWRRASCLRVRAPGFWGCVRLGSVMSLAPPTRGCVARLGMG